MYRSKLHLSNSIVVGTSLLAALTATAGCGQKKAPEPIRASDYTATIPASALPPDVKDRMDTVAKDPNLTDVQKHAAMARLGQEAYQRNSMRH